jgi:preprotein translocase subunit SecE
VIVDVAAEHAARAAGTPDMSAAGIAGPSGRPLYQATALDTLALVDVQTGTVLEVILENQMPDAADRVVGPAAAQVAAERFLTRTGMSVEGLGAAVELMQSAGVAAYKVTWTTRDDVATPMIQVLVAASTGAVFAYLDLSLSIHLIAPIISRARAVDLAMASAGWSGPPVSADLRLSFNARGAQVSVWRIVAGVDVDVNAITGKVTRSMR